MLYFRRRSQQNHSILRRSAHSGMRLLERSKEQACIILTTRQWAGNTIVRTQDRTDRSLIRKNALSAPLLWTNTRPFKPASVLLGLTCSGRTEAPKDLPTSIMP